MALQIQKYAKKLAEGGTLRVKPARQSDGKPNGEAFTLRQLRELEISKS